MGKGGTRFVSDAIGSRNKAKGYTAKDRNRDMDTFLATGVSVLLVASRLAAAVAHRH